MTFFSFFRRCSETSRGRVVLVEERQVGVEFTLCADKWTHMQQKDSLMKFHSSRNVLLFNYIGQCLWVKTHKISGFVLPRKFPLPLLFLIAVKFFPETLFCNQSAHSGSYNYSTSSVQLTAPEQSSSENGTHFYFDNGCRGVQLIARN